MQNCILCQEYYQCQHHLLTLFDFQGNAVGQTGLGMMYMYGKGVAKVSVYMAYILSVTCLGEENLLNSSNDKIIQNHLTVHVKL